MATLEERKRALEKPGRSGYTPSDARDIATAIKETISANQSNIEATSTILARLRDELAIIEAEGGLQRDYEAKRITGLIESYDAGIQALERQITADNEHIALLESE